MAGNKVIDFQRYEKGKQTLTLLVNVFILVGFLSEVITFHKIYIPLQLYLQIFSICVFSTALVILLINKKRYYSMVYLIVSYFLLFNIIIYDVLFPEFIAKLNFLPSEFFSRNMFFILPFIAFIGFVTDKKHIIIQGVIVLIYIAYQSYSNNDAFIKASILNYFLTTIGFCWVIYFLVNANARFIKDLEESNKKLKETQQHLVQSEKMASLGTLTSGVAHEINNPLNFIGGGVQILSELEEEINESVPKDVKEKYDLASSMINSGFERTSSIIKALMTFSTRESDELIDSDINSIIDNTILFLNNKFPKDVEIVREYGFHGNVPIFPSKFHQVIMSIIDNAIYAVSQADVINKTITISTKLVSENVIITISNKGSRIPEMILNQIFDPFFTTKEPGQGTGLGLSLCYTLISELNGKIYARNNADGVSFVIELPVKLFSVYKNHDL